MRLLAGLFLAASVLAQTANPFGTQARLDAHWRKHVVEQKEFPASCDKACYAAAAARLRDAKADGKTVHERRRKDGSRVKFDKATGEFGAYRGALVLTHFKPAKNGWRYFLRQR